MPFAGSGLVRGSPPHATELARRPWLKVLFWMPNRGLACTLPSVNTSCLAPDAGATIKAAATPTPAPMTTSDFIENLVKTVICFPPRPPTDVAGSARHTSDAAWNRRGTQADCLLQEGEHRVDVHRDRGARARRTAVMIRH